MDDTRYAKRARQACEPCRRKKSKCPGERPTCSFCERLGQHCVYNTPGEASDSRQTPRNSDTESRLRSLEHKMDRLIQHLIPESRPPQPSTSTRHVMSPKRVTHVDPGSVDDTSAVARSPSPSDPAEAPLMEMGRRYLLWFHGQPITLFDEDTFLQSLSSRDPELILSLQALVLRFPPGALTNEVKHQLDEKARTSRRMVMDRVTEGRVELSTLQSLCLLNMFDFASGNITQSGLNLTIAIHLAHSIPPSANPANAKERNYCLRSIFVLQHLQGCIVPASNPAPSLLPGSSTTSPTPLGSMPYCRFPVSHSENLPEKNISTVAADFCVVWRMARAYAASPVSPDSPPPWDSRSDYSQVLQSHHDIDCRAPQKFRFATNRIDKQTPEALQAQRRYWMPFLFIQFVHETIPCLLNHPFLLSMRLRHFRHTMPVHFIQQSFESMNRTAGWVIFFLDVLEKKSLTVSDPVVAHCVVVVATIHLQHSFVQDPVLRSKAKTGFEKCMNFLRKTGDVWPCVANMANNLRKLQDSVVIKPPPDRGDYTSQNRSFSIDTQLLWNLLIYDRAGRPDAGWDQSMFGSTLRSDAEDLSTGTDAADFDLVGSAGISAHKAVPNQAAVYAPDEDIAPVAVPENSTPGGQSLGDMGPSFEDMFFEGVGPFGDQANRFIEANDYGRAIDDWLNLDN
ncbi:c6 transcription factor [Colletotrichum incanum]|uniref:C6 transcription factor n=1 Tax=Colletotrichum incanum TaxID=1573173 RepID=A0A166XHC4_COLIC|nr:c6 transcription factor [Colletotrichum incanum]